MFDVWKNSQKQTFVAYIHKNIISSDSNRKTPPGTFNT